jgi:hypothetical protein
MKSKSETKEGIACSPPPPPPPPIFCSTRCGPEHGHCVFFYLFSYMKKFYLKYITKMLSSFFRYYKMLVSLGLHEYIYNVLHMNTRYNSEVFNLYYKNIIQYRITEWNILSYEYDTKFQNFALQSYYKNIFSQEYINYNLFYNVLYIPLYNTWMYYILQKRYYLLHKITILYVINYSDPWTIWGPHL